MESSPLGQREAARRTLQDQGIDIIANAFVTRVEAGEQPPVAEASSSDSGRRVVHLKLPGEQSQASTKCPLIGLFLTSCIALHVNLGRAQKQGNGAVEVQTCA